MTQKLVMVLVAAIVLAFGVFRADASIVPPVVINVLVDEWGDGFYTNAQGQSVLLHGLVIEDPSTTAVDSALVFALPFVPVPGDVLINEAGATTQPIISDGVRFFQNFLIFYSDFGDEGAASPPADTGPGLPPDFRPVATVTEDALGVAYYVNVPANGPGFVPGTLVTNYVFMSDQRLNPVPEPVTMIGLGLGVTMAFIRKRRSLLGQR